LTDQSGNMLSMPSCVQQG